MTKDYYNILGIERSASKDDVKKAFRKLAHKYHPDKKGGDEAKFKEVNEAYSVLGNDKKRAEYDTYGQTFGSGEAPFGSASGFDFSGFQDFGGGQGFNAADFSDIFSEFFGGGARKSNVKRGRDISIDIEISFGDSIFGTERRVLLNKTSVCDKCTGSGAREGSAIEKCGTCNGQGVIRETRGTILGTFTSTAECSACRGSGKVSKDKCKTCAGFGVVKNEEEIVIKIPAGIQNGEMIRLSGAGEAVQNGIAGDLYTKVHVSKHPVFQREGSNLVMDLNIKLTDALLGGEYTIGTLDGNINLKIPKGVSFGEILRIREKGVPVDSRRRGDLLVHLNIQLPNKLSKKAENLMKDLKEEGM